MNHNANVVVTADREQKNKEKETTLQFKSSFHECVDGEGQAQAHFVQYYY